MAEIKRLNYFTNQFLLEKDFDDEQAYHLQSSRRHNALLHTPGVAEGLAVTFVNANHVHITAGTAIDSGGREIVLTAAIDIEIPTGTPNTDVYLAIAYNEAFDEADRYTQGGVNDFIRVTERPRFQQTPTAPDSSADAGVLLARIRLNATGVMASASAITTTVRVLAGTKLAPLSVGNAHIAATSIDESKLTDGAVTLNKHGPNSIDRTKIMNGEVTLDKLAANAVDESKLADGAVTLNKLASALRLIPEKLSGKFITATFTSAPPAAQIIGRDLRGKLIFIQGWSASATDGTPTNLAGGTPIKAWDVTTIPHRSAYAICKTSTGVPVEVTLFTFTEGTNSVTYKLQFTATALNLTVTTSPASFGTSYAFKISWVE